MTELAPVARLSRDLAAASVTLTDEEARYLVDAYYIMQEDRKRANNQARSMDAEPNSVIQWLADQSDTLENQIKRALDKYTSSKPIGEWMKGIHGIGPVISAGLIAHIDINKAPTVGHIWRFAGLDPTMKWNKGEKRPWNARLKTLSWKIGQSFMKFSNDDACFYGHIYRQRKALETERNERGDNAKRAAEILTEKNWNKSTDAYKHYTSGKLPPAQVDARARRYAVKMFLSHLQCIWWYLEKGELPARPYILTQEGGHAHMVAPHNTAGIPGFDEAFSQTAR